LQVINTLNAASTCYYFAPRGVRSIVMSMSTVFVCLSLCPLA